MGMGREGVLEGGDGKRRSRDDVSTQEGRKEGNTGDARQFDISVIHE
jgi:hypothetical protein